MWQNNNTDEEILRICDETFPDAIGYDRLKRYCNVLELQKSFDVDEDSIDEDTESSHHGQPTAHNLSAEQKRLLFLLRDKYVSMTYRSLHGRFIVCWYGNFDQNRNRFSVDCIR